MHAVNDSKLLPRFLEHTPQRIAMFDRQMRYLFASKCWLIDYGLEENTVLSSQHEQLFPDLSLEWQTGSDRCLSGEATQCELDKLTLPDGREIWHRWEMQPWRDENGKIGGAIAIADSIPILDPKSSQVNQTQTSQEQNQLNLALLQLQTEVEKRKQAQSELDNLFNLSSDLLGIAGADGYFKRVNPAFQQILGFSTEEFLAKPFLDFVHPDDVESTVAEAEKLATGRVTIYFENRYLCRNGAYKWIAWSAVPNADGLIHFVGRDITENKQFQTQLQQYQEQLEDLVEERTVQLRAEISDRQKTLKQLRKSRKRLQLINRISTSINAGMSVEEIIACAVQLVSESFPKMRVAYSTIDRQGNLKVIRSIEPPEMPALKGLEVNLNTAPAYLQALQNEKLVAIADVTADSRIAPLTATFLANEIRAVLDLPLQHSQTLVGLLCLDSPVAKKWRKNEIASLTEVAEYLAIAIKESLARKQSQEAEIALRESETRFQRLATNLPGIIYQYRMSSDRREKFTYISPGCRELYELEPEQIQENAASLYQLVHPDDLPKLANTIAVSAQTLQPWNLEFRIITPSGKMKWLQARSRPEQQANGDLIWDGLMLDISDRILAEQQRDNFFQLSLEMLAIANLDGYFTQLNPAWEKTLGWTREELSAKPFVDFVHPEDREATLKQAQAAEENIIISFENRYLCQDGSYKWLSWNSAFSVEQNMIYAVARDISDRKAAEVKLKEREQFLSTIYNGVEQAIFVVNVTPDNDFRYVGWNSVGERIGGVSSQDAEGKTPEETFGATLGAFMRQRYTDCLNSGKAMTYEESFIDNDRETWSLTTIKPLRDRQGRISQLIGTGYDISDRKLTEIALVESEAKYRALAEREALINSLANLIRESLDLETILATTVTEIRNLLKCDRCMFAWYKGEAKIPVWEVIKEAKSPKLKTMEGVYPASLPNSTEIDPITEKLLCAEVLRVDDVYQYPNVIVRKNLKSYKGRALLILPVRTLSGEVGALSCIHHRSERPWTNSEVELVEIVVDQLAIALNQAELYQQTQQTAKTAQKQAQELQFALDQLQRTQIQLVQSEKMSSLGQMVAGIAHEINNPVNFIHGNLTHADEYTQDLLGLLQLYQQTYPHPSSEIADEIEAIDLEFLLADLPKLISSMKVGSERIREIVKSLRVFSRLDEAEMKSVDIHECIESTLMILHNRLKFKSDRPSIEVIKDYGTLPAVECFPGQLNQVLMNILTNAIDALEDYNHKRSLAEIKANPSQIRITTEIFNDNQIKIAIADNGEGINETTKQRLFDPFFTTKPVGKGTGLGLSISYSIITERHGGTLECYSTPGQGAKFTIQIPIHQPEFRDCKNSNTRN
ncbi:MAG: PAS domain S-box protein [Oscillatoria sp. PMC 1068.18]|nr:PAS domain S-box protein [Oscillatoria sp. PMC 1076.18]MEC4990687.1 PAS domain S-box protein [Oscillatoria sp. PMC 1068.18]